MLDIFFLLLLIMAGGLFIIGVARENFALTFLGSVLFIVLGLVLQTEGVALEPGYHINKISSTVTDVNVFYAAYSSANDLGAWAISQIFLYGGILGVLASLVISIKNYNTPDIPR